MLNEWVFEAYIWQRRHKLLAFDIANYKRSACYLEGLFCRGDHPSLCAHSSEGHFNRSSGSSVSRLHDEVCHSVWVATHQHPANVRHCVTVWFQSSPFLFVLGYAYVSLSLLKLTPMQTYALAKVVCICNPICQSIPQMLSNASHNLCLHWVALLPKSQWIRLCDGGQFHWQRKPVPAVKIKCPLKESRTEFLKSVWDGQCTCLLKGSVGEWPSCLWVVMQINHWFEVRAQQIMPVFGALTSWYAQTFHQISFWKKKGVGKANNQSKA